MEKIGRRVTYKKEPGIWVITGCGLNEYSIRRLNKGEKVELSANPSGGIVYSDVRAKEREIDNVWQDQLRWTVYTLVILIPVLYVLFGGILKYQAWSKAKDQSEAYPERVACFSDCDAKHVHNEQNRLTCLDQCEVKWPKR